MHDTKITPASTSSSPTVVRGHSTESVRQAREAARAFTDSLIPLPDPATADTLVLVVSELATNALRHGGGRYTIELSATADVVTVAVSDPNPVRPRERTPDLNGGSGGFGWHMVRRLTTGLTITPGPGSGKTIRARIPRLGS
ncbi:ATP-binding protein [Streptomyces sp. NPDC048518]|uniref:ATP-binding protein n=1 Tax=Streptomyces sp. NPDC048518 TaxID=3155029 RepID=UPI00340CD136